MSTAVFYIFFIFLSQIVMTQTQSNACPIGWSEFRGSCYAFSRDSVTFYQAAAFCNAHGATMLEIRTTDENDWIVDQLKDREFVSVWLGASDMFLEGRYMWLSTQTEIDLSAVAWGLNNPSNSGGYEHCLEFNIGARMAFFMNDDYCQASNRFICQKTPKRIGPGLSYDQVVTPQRACEIGCLHKKEPALRQNKAVIAECSDYCFKHAYDFIVEMLTSLPPEYNLNGSRPAPGK